MSMVEISRYPTIKYDNIIYGPDEVKLQIDEFSTLFAKTKTQKIVLILENKMKIVCAMMAALKNQVCFIPVDCNLPEKRIDEILQEQSDALILTEGEYSSRVRTRRLTISLWQVSENSPPNRTYTSQRIRLSRCQSNFPACNLS